MYKEDYSSICIAELEYPDNLAGKIVGNESLIAKATIAYTLAFSAVSISDLVNGSYSLWPHVASVSTFILSDIADMASTYNCFKSSQKAIEHGVKHGCRERNPLLDHVETPQQLITDLKSYRASILGIGLSFFPGFGLPLAAAKTLAALSNIRIAKVLNHAVKISPNNSGQ